MAGKGRKRRGSCRRRAADRAGSGNLHSTWHWHRHESAAIARNVLDADGPPAVTGSFNATISTSRAGQIIATAFTIFTTFRVRLRQSATPAHAEQRVDRAADVGVAAACLPKMITASLNI